MDPFEVTTGYLILSRKKGEKVMIGYEVVVEVMEIRGDKVRLGISAPESVSVHREEVWLEIQKQKIDDNRR